MNNKKLLLLISSGASLRNFILSDFSTLLQKHIKTSIYCEDSIRSLDNQINNKNTKINYVNYQPNNKVFNFINGILNNSFNYHSEFYNPIYKKWFLKKVFGIKWFLSSLSFFISKYIHSSSLIFKILEKVESLMIKYSPNYNLCLKIMEEEKPDLVFSTNLYDINEIIFSNICNKKNIDVFSFINSWDNLRYMGRIINSYKKYFVWGDMNFNDLMKHKPNLDLNMVHRVGSPQFNFHFSKNLFKSRTELFNHLNISIKNKLIFYCANTENIFPDEPDLVEKIFLDTKTGLIKHASNLVVRLHPFDRYQRFDNLKKKYPEIIFFQSENYNSNDSGKKNYFPKQKDLILFSNVLRFSDVCINMGSTVTLDASLLSRPTIVINFSNNLESDSHELISNIHSYGHYSEIDSNIIPFAKSYSELITNINIFLKGKNLNKKELRNMVNYICGPLGKSTKIISSVINDS